MVLGGAVLGEVGLDLGDAQLGLELEAHAGFAVFHADVEGFALLVDLAE